MSAKYRNIETKVDADGTIVAQLEIENKGPEPWFASEGFAVGYHLFDSETGTLVVDGAREPCDLMPGGRSQLAMKVALPPEPGRYRIHVSPMRENHGWFYEQGWPFVLIDAEVNNAGAGTIRDVRTATRSFLRRDRLRKSLLHAFTLSFLTIWRNRDLMRSLVKRDVLGRYRGSFGGAFWAGLNPLLLMLTYFFVFGVVLQTKFEGDPSHAGFALYFLAGMLPWLSFSEAAGRAPTVLLEHRVFIKKLVFPIEILPVNLVASGLVTEVFGLVVFSIGLILARGTVPASVFWLPLLLVPQILLTAGISWFLAALGVFVRDLAQINGYLLTLLFFLTPICYPERSLPKAAAAVLSKNPLYLLVRGYRDVFLHGVAPEWGSLWKLWLVAAIVFVAGHAWFYKLRKSFADII